MAAFHITSIINYNKSQKRRKEEYIFFILIFRYDQIINIIFLIF